MHARLRKAMAARDQGFTLIELLVVMIIIGVLAAIAIPVFLNQRKKGVDASLKSDLRSMAMAQETYITDNPIAGGYFGTTATGPLNVAAGATDATVGFTASQGNVLRVVPKDGGYCISAWNAGGTATSDTNAFRYDSTKGGLLPTKGAATCA